MNDHHPRLVHSNRGTEFGLWAALACDIFYSKEVLYESLDY